MLGTIFEVIWLRDDFQRDFCRRQGVSEGQYIAVRPERNNAVYGKKPAENHTERMGRT